MNYIYYVRYPDGRKGVGHTCEQACEAAIGSASFSLQQFRAKKDPRGYEWSAWIPRTTTSVKHNHPTAPVSSLPLSYETCSVSYNNEQLYEVFRAPSIKAIHYLAHKYGNPKQLPGTGFAFNAKTKDLTARAKQAQSTQGPSTGQVRKARSSARRVD